MLTVNEPKALETLDSGFDRGTVVLREVGPKLRSSAHNRQCCNNSVLCVNVAEKIPHVAAI